MLLTNTSSKDKMLAEGLDSISGGKHTFLKQLELLSHVLGPEVKGVVERDINPIDLGRPPQQPQSPASVGRIC